MAVSKHGQGNKVFRTLQAEVQRQPRSGAAWGKINPQTPCFKMGHDWLWKGDYVVHWPDSRRLRCGILWVTNTKEGGM